MTAQDKAFDLVVLFTDKHNGVRKELAKKFATICVNEMIRVAPWGGDNDVQIEDGSKEFYMNVKTEIEKL